MAMEASSSTCCASKEERDAADAARFGLPDPRELQDDPVLAGCCEEDLRNMRAAEALRNALLDVDRSTARLKLQQQALHIPHRQQQQQEQPGNGALGDLDLGDSDGEDEQLLELRRRRLAELQRQAAERQQLADRGYGRLNDVASSSLLERVGQLEGPGAAAVAHLAVAGCEVGAQLDEHLSCLGHQYGGTFFCRVAVKRGDPLASRLHLQGLPALVCFRHGVLAGRASVSTFGPPGCLVEEEVTSYLKRLRVLREAAPAAGNRRAHAAAAAGSSWSAAAASEAEQDGDGSEEDGEWRVKPCDVCGRRYPHEHVRAVYGTCQRGSDSSGEESR